MQVVADRHTNEIKTANIRVDAAFNVMQYEGSNPSSSIKLPPAEWSPAGKMDDLFYVYM